MGDSPTPSLEPLLLSPCVGSTGARMHTHMLTRVHTQRCMHTYTHMLTLTPTPLVEPSFPMAWEGKHSSGCHRPPRQLAASGSEIPRFSALQAWKQMPPQRQLSHGAKITHVEWVSRVGRHQSHAPTTQCCLHPTSPRVLHPQHSPPEPDTQRSLHHRQTLKVTLLLFRSTLGTGREGPHGSHLRDGSVSRTQKGGDSRAPVCSAGLGAHKRACAQSQRVGGR